jgi:hypothetical protein
MKIEGSQKDPGYSLSLYGGTYVLQDTPLISELLELLFLIQYKITTFFPKKIKKNEILSKILKILMLKTAIIRQK